MLLRQHANETQESFLEVKSAICHCGKNHSPGCGCMSKGFIERSRNNFSQILSESQSASEFARRLRALYHHVRDQHEWDGGECEFHAKTVCSCGQCGKLEKHDCNGKAYKTRNRPTTLLHITLRSRTKLHWQTPWSILS